MKRDGTFDDMTVVIFADHGFRFGGEERDPRHIPFIVKLPGQGSGEIVVEPHEGERLLWTCSGSRANRLRDGGQRGFALSTADFDEACRDQPHLREYARCADHRGYRCEKLAVNRAT